MRVLLLVVLCMVFQGLQAQRSNGILSGNLLDEKQRPVEGSTVQLINLQDTLTRFTASTNKLGEFTITNISWGMYRLRITHIGFQNLIMDSIHFREDRAEFNISDLMMNPASGSLMDEVLIYAEKPLIQTRDGNITFNASESPLSAGSSASELLESVPLISKDPSGKILVRGKEPRILIDDKPVELNMQQLQDLLESLPGSAIEKIEVMTNPPPQYANEQGGVINIITKKGTVGINGRINVFYGTRTQAGVNGSFNYRKQGFNLSVQAGAGFNQFDGYGYSKRENIFKDSSNYFNSNNNFLNESLRPNFRTNIQYDINKNHALSLVLNYNQNQFDNSNLLFNINQNRFEEIFRLRRRMITSTGSNFNPSMNFSYTFKTKKPGETLRLFTNLNFSSSDNERILMESLLNPDYTETGKDSTQQQLNANNTRSSNIRIQYDVPLIMKKTFLSLGSFVNSTRSDVNLDAFYQGSSDGKWKPLDALTNQFVFRQQVKNIRSSVKQVWSENLSTTAGISAEETNIEFELIKAGSDTSNNYWSYLPFANINKSWNGIWNLSFAYRKTIRRPGERELNPTVDFSDPFHLRFGNPGLLPSLAHNYDVVFGRNKNDLYINLGIGYNKVKDIYSAIRSRISADTTQTTWQNISGRQEYELSLWSGYKLSKSLRVNLSSSYVYNTYSDYDKQVRKFRDGGSLTSNLNTSYSIKDLYTISGNFTYNRFANPQGTARNNLNMNMGLQAKLMDKRIIATLNIIDPFFQQENHSFTYGTNFNLENFSRTATRNYRMSVAYVFKKTMKSPSLQPDQKKGRNLPGAKGKS
jgi:outer membrane receptor for ferrienterochelin and colicin